MAKRTGGFIGQDGINAPDPATGVEASAGDEQASVSFTSPSDVGGADITEYRVTDSTGAFGATGSASPITVSGLTNGTSYTFNVWAINPFGWSTASDASGGVSPAASIGVFGGGYNSGTELNVNVIQSVNIASAGNATDFGDLLATNANMVSGVSSTTRGLFAGGEPSGLSNVIQYITFSSAGNATDFGDLTVARKDMGGISNSTRGVFAGGNSGSATNTIDYITIASAGNAIDFGDLLSNIQSTAGLSSSTRGVIGGGREIGYGNAILNTIQYVTIASAGNATDFGDLTQTTWFISGLSSATRGVFGGGLGSSSNNVISYITIASTGNAADFGDLTDGIYTTAPASDSVTGLFAGGWEDTANATVNKIDQITIATTGNATDFGDLTIAVYTSGCSNAHGGLQ